MNTLELFYEDIQPLLIQKTFIEVLIKKLINNELKEMGDISVIFCSDSYLLKMNKQYLNHNYYTDIITFDYVDNNVISGDLFISIERVKENAKKFESEFKEELLRVVFHGVLHLIGYNDKTEDERKKMREKENLYLCEVDFKKIEL